MSLSTLICCWLLLVIPVVHIRWLLAAGTRAGPRTLHIETIASLRRLLLVVIAVLRPLMRWLVCVRWVLVTRRLVVPAVVVLSPVLLLLVLIFAVVAATGSGRRQVAFDRILRYIGGVHGRVLRQKLHAVCIPFERLGEDAIRTSERVGKVAFLPSVRCIVHRHTPGRRS